VASCTPMRSSFLMGTRATGPNGHGITGTTPFLTTEDLEASLPTWLGAEGVSTGHFGKWYLGNTTSSQPGWDRMVISTGGVTAHNKATGYSIVDSDLGGVIQPSVRQTDFLASELVDWIGNQTGDWFAWAALHQPHIPNEPSDESAERY